MKYGDDKSIFSLMELFFLWHPFREKPVLSISNYSLKGKTDIKTQHIKTSWVWLTSLLSQNDHFHHRVPDKTCQLKRSHQKRENCYQTKEVMLFQYALMVSLYHLATKYYTTQKFLIQMLYEQLLTNKNFLETFSFKNS